MLRIYISFQPKYELNTVIRLAMKNIEARTIWISDVHLGFKGCQADALSHFLHSISCEKLYLVGDIIDVWNMKRGLFWPQEHNNIARTVLGLAKKGIEVIYIPGNHDEILRQYNGLSFGNIKIRNRVVHETANGKKLMVMHGDEFDSVIKCHPFVAQVGCYAYDYLLEINHWVNMLRKKLGKPYWSISAYLKYKVKNAVNFISQYEHILADAARAEGVDGIVCGHIHHAQVDKIGEIDYYNTGDWVESCTALLEGYDGEISLIRWSEYLNRTMRSGEKKLPQAA